MSRTLFDPDDSARDGAAPLAARMRPQTPAEIVGQQHVLADGSPLRRLLDDADESRTRQPSVILWGPPGSGKTTIATLLASSTRRRFVELSAVTAGVKEVREVIRRAQDNLAMGETTLLFIDEVHRFSKTQQDALLPAVEHGWVRLVAATTENPSFAVVGPLLSRSIVVRLQPLSETDLQTLLDRALTSPHGLAGGWQLTPAAAQMLVRRAAGDARVLLTSLEAAAGAATGDTIDEDVIAQALDTVATRYDRDEHYDIASALIKSVRGSDVDAALHYLARMLAAGEEPRFITRRLVILASEDIGMADSNAMVMANAALQIVSTIGMPEARITLGHLVTYLSLAPKSNRVYAAINAALADVNAGLTPPVPAHLRDASYAGAKGYGHGIGYQYPHDSDRGVVPQQHLDASLSDRSYYQPSSRGAEAKIAERHELLRSLVRDNEPTRFSPPNPERSK